MSHQHQRILALLEMAYPDAKPSLHFQNAYQLLVATMLSAQCTDKQVNRITPALFERFPTVESLSMVEAEMVEPYVKSCGFYHTKARHLVAACRALMRDYGGVVPGDLEALAKLPGVGRKTANVVGSNAFGIDAIPVDTHVFRVANRLGLANAKDVLKTELQLQQVIPKDQWSAAHHWLIYHGRQICHARKPNCGHCPVFDLCPSAQQLSQ